MKRIVSVSLGAVTRDHAASIRILDEEVRIERIGTDGDLERAIALVRELDGKVDAFGMGGMDLHVRAAGRFYSFRDARRLRTAAVRSPMCDGSGLKNTLERHVVLEVDRRVLSLARRPVLLVSSVDRFGMAEALRAVGADLVYGDLMFGLGLPVPLRSARALDRVAAGLLPIVTRLPFRWLYPTGEQQGKRVVRFQRDYQDADVIAGDFLYINRHMPERLDGKVILTNTVTSHDVDGLRRRGVWTLITTTPSIGGRSFGTNVMEALLVAMAGRAPEDMTPSAYDEWITRLGFEPRIETLNPRAA